MALTAEFREWVEKEHSLRRMLGSDAREEWARDIRADYVLKLAGSQGKVREGIAKLETEKLRLIEQRDQSTRQDRFPFNPLWIEDQERKIAEVEATSVEIDALIAEAQGRIDAKWWIDERDMLKSRALRYPQSLPTSRLSKLRKPPLSKVVAG